ncbi:unnamed protein product, partial [Pylaiella littoralis]
GTRTQRYAVEVAESTRLGLALLTKPETQQSSEEQLSTQHTLCRDIKQQISSNIYQSVSVSWGISRAINTLRYGGVGGVGEPWQPQRRVHMSGGCGSKCSVTRPLTIAAAGPLRPWCRPRNFFTGRRHGADSLYNSSSHYSIGIQRRHVDNGRQKQR